MFYYINSEHSNIRIVKLILMAGSFFNKLRHSGQYTQFNIIVLKCHSKYFPTVSSTSSEKCPLPNSKT